MAKFYLTTAISYVNAPPHIGHALEFIQADALARYHRMTGDDTFYLTGTDEHGVKIFDTAAERGITAQELVDENAEKFKALEGILDLSYDDFIRTSSAMHKSACQKIWMKMFEAGDIYKDTYKGKYCVGCEGYKADKDLDENGNCPNHNKPPEILEEENYFFRLSKYSDKIKAAIESGELKVLPETRKNEMLNIIGDEGLHDVSFSRPKKLLPWGVDVPNDPDQVMYVWCDALSNYITAIGYEEETEQFKKYWPCDAHIIGKDILRFHAGIWIGMLMSAELPIPKGVYVHGFITSDGRKMGKSLGNVVDPLEYVDKYGVDAVRYYLLREIPTTDDGDFSHSRFVDLFNSELANSLGNLVNRVVMMTDRYVDGKVPAVTDGGDVAGFVDNILKQYHAAFEAYDIKKACELVVEMTNYANKYIDDMKPWAMAKEDGSAADLAAVLYNLLELVRFIAYLIHPIVPAGAEKIMGQLGLEVPDQMVLEETWGLMKEGAAVNPSDPIFPRIEE
jgi:methionyl-tRNA synthetase